MTAVIGMVAFILVMIGISTSAILSQVLYTNLDASVTETASGLQPRVVFQDTADEVLESGRFPTGTLLVMNSRSGYTAAVVADEGVRALSTDDLGQIVDSLRTADPTPTVDLPNLGEYLVRLYPTPGSDAVFLVGLPLSNVTGTIGAILTTVALVTAGGLLLLAVVIAVVIRLGLRPLRAVAETATRVASLRMEEGDISSTSACPLTSSTSTPRREWLAAPQHPARSRRRLAHRAPAQRGAHASLRRRREPRVAHPLAPSAGSASCRCARCVRRRTTRAASARPWPWRPPSSRSSASRPSRCG